jgi:hypothetical protein
MKRTYDVYGTSGELISAANRVSDALGIGLALHSSDYLGGDYYRTPFPDDTVQIIRNADDDPDELPYEQYAQYAIIVEVNESPRADEYQEKLVAAGFDHLEREII